MLSAVKIATSRVDTPLEPPPREISRILRSTSSATRRRCSSRSSLATVKVWPKIFTSTMRFIVGPSGNIEPVQTVENLLQPRLELAALVFELLHLPRELRELLFL